MQKSF